VGQHQDIPWRVQRNNYIVAGTLFACTGGIYYYAMRKMKEVRRGVVLARTSLVFVRAQTDDLAALEMEDKVNVHESGLKVSKPRNVHEAIAGARKADK